jgi:hypothetical protein
MDFRPLAGSYSRHSFGAVKRPFHTGDDLKWLAGLFLSRNCWWALRYVHV